MNALETVNAYLDSIHTGDWHRFIAEPFAFGNNTLEETSDREGYLRGAGQFFQRTTSVKVISMVSEGNNVALVARYTTLSPDGRSGSLDVAEFITVSNGKLDSNAIFFNTAAFAAFVKGT